MRQEWLLCGDWRPLLRCPIVPQVQRLSWRMKRARSKETSERLHEIGVVQGLFSRDLVEELFLSLVCLASAALLSGVTRTTAVVTPLIHGAAVCRVAFASAGVAERS